MASIITETLHMKFLYVQFFSPPCPLINSYLSYKSYPSESFSRLPRWRQQKYFKLFVLKYFFMSLAHMSPAQWLKFAVVA